MKTCLIPFSVNRRAHIEAHRKAPAYCRYIHYKAQLGVSLAPDGSEYYEGITIIEDNRAEIEFKAILKNGTDIEETRLAMARFKQLEEAKQYCRENKYEETCEQKSCSREIFTGDARFRLYGKVYCNKCGASKTDDKTGVENVKQ